ncbi:MAG TPA: dihydrodipicolinate reductase [Acidilobales archaeon]|nr:dihydrodipicolinate reductase [Acidilobales archaeon]
MRVVVYGVGHIGSLVAKYAIKKGFEVVGAIDTDPNKVGKDLGVLVGIEERLGIIVSSDAESVIKSSRPDIVIHATSSWLDEVLPQIMIPVRYGIDVVSTCETLSYPYYRYPHLAELLDVYARRYGATILGTGINPGFLLDTLPALLTLPHINIDRVIARRFVNAGSRRYSFQYKIGLGLRPEEFRDKLARRELTGHVGYAESVMLMASIMNVKLDSVEEGQEPVIAGSNEYLRTKYFEIRPGHVKGIRGYGVGYVGGREFIRIEFHAVVGSKDYEEIEVLGEPRIKWVSTGTPGDEGTVAVLLNLAPKVVELEPGLKTMADLVRASYSFKG